MDKQCEVSIKDKFGSKDKVAQFRPTGDTNFPLAFRDFGTEMLHGVFNVQMPEGEMMPYRCAMDWLQENGWSVTVK